MNDNQEIIVKRYLNFFETKKNRIILNSFEEKEIIKRYSAGESSEKIAEDFLVVGSSVARCLDRNGIKIRPSEENKRKYWINKDFFKNINTEEKAYFLGILYADGCTYSKGEIKIGLKIYDYEIVYKLSLLIYGENRVTLVGGDINTAKLTFYSQEIVNDLKNLGCAPNKTFDIRLPSLDTALMPHFIRGYFDGDGCVSSGKEGTRTTFDITSNLNFIKDLNCFLCKIGFNPKYYQNKINPLSGFLQINSRSEFIKMYEYLYKNANIYMERKYNKYKEIFGKSLNHKDFTVKKMLNQVYYNYEPMNYDYYKQLPPIWKEKVIKFFSSEIDDLDPNILKIILNKLHAKGRNIKISLVKSYYNDYLNSIKNNKFHMLNIISEYTDTDGTFMLKCQCDCGEYKDLSKWSVLEGRSKCCGCSDLVPKRIKIQKEKPDAWLQTMKQIKREHDLFNLFSVEELKIIILKECAFCNKTSSYKSNFYKKHEARAAGTNLESGAIQHNSIISRIEKNDLNKENYVSCCKTCKNKDLQILKLWFDRNKKEG